MVNSKKLYQELESAGLEISSVDENGVVFDKEGDEIQERKDVAAIIAAHDPDDRWDVIRTQRDALLRKTDWTQLTDAALTLEEKLVWSTYRQALRDVPQNFSDPDLIIWPEVPNG